MVKNKLTKATYWEFEASIFGAMFIAFGIGVLLNKYFINFAPVVILIGILMHGWGMYKIHKRSR